MKLFLLITVFALAAMYGLGVSYNSVMERFGWKENALTGKIEELKGQVKDQTLLLEKEKERREKFDGHRDSFAEMTEVEKQLEQEGGEILRIREQIQKTNTVAQDLRGQLDRYRNKYRDKIRTQAKGELIDLSTTHGEGFENCRIFAVTPLHLSVMTATGPVNIEYQKLPASLQERFQFSKEEAAAYSAWIRFRDEQEALRIADFREKQRAIQAEEAIEAQKQELVEMEKRVDQLKSEIDELENLAEEWDIKAGDYTREAKDARASGRTTSKFTLAARAKEKVTYLRNQAKRKRVELNDLEITFFRLRAENQ